jgi:8-oxo-dGTP diphosphatase
MQLTRRKNNMSTTKHYPMPFTRLELCVFGVSDTGLSVLLGSRQEAPEKGKWALPGGVLRIDLDKDLPAAAQRVAVERIGTRLPYLSLQSAIGGKGRDSRAPWTLSLAFRAVLRPEEVSVAAGKRMDALQWVPAEEAAQASLAFDHAAIISAATSSLRTELEDLNFPPGLLPSSFTLGELQLVCEQVLGRPLDKSSFRRRLADKRAVKPLAGEFRAGANRPAQVYELQ